MALDYFAIATQGFFPTPTPTDRERMVRAASWGYLDADNLPITVVGRIRKWLATYYRRTRGL